MRPHRGVESTATACRRVSRWDHDHAGGGYASGRWRRPPRPQPGHHPRIDPTARVRSFPSARCPRPLDSVNMPPTSIDPRLGETP
jgi:hypothetical protein